MRAPFRFLFSDNDAGLIIGSSLQLSDATFSEDWPLSLRLRCTTSTNDRLTLRPFAECKMRFIVDPSAPGILPKPEEVAFDDASYSKWKVIGTLIWDFEPKATKALDEIEVDLATKPNRIWLSSVTIPKEFLFDSLTQKQRLDRGPLRGGKVKMSNDPAKELRWQQHAIADFLGGDYAPLIRFHKDDPTKDDAIRMPMPWVGFKPAENIHEVRIFTARATDAQDGLDNDWDPGLSENEATKARLQVSHPHNGVVPARLVFQDLRSNMVPAVTDAAKAIRTAVTEPAPGARAFSFVRFTRTRLPIQNCSIHFPKQTIVFRSPASTELRRQMLPAHGILWIESNFFANFSDGTTISVEGGMRWLPATANAWLFAGMQDPVPMDNSSEPQHIVLRVPMSVAMLEDRNRPLGEFFACTFLSMRRTVRALIDNRITGGYLNKDVKNTPKAIRDLFSGTNINSFSVAFNEPDPTGSPNTGTPMLLPLLNHLFPGPCDQHPIAGVPPPTNPITWSRGTAAYWLWQSGDEELKDPRKVRNISDEDMGRGGPGAVVNLGIANYHLNIPPPPGAGSAYTDQMVGLMLAGLQPGATTQLWRDIDDYRDLMNRTTPAKPVEQDPSGHSPIFAHYTSENGSVTKLSMIDQAAQHDYEVEGTPPNRKLHGGKVWIAANWTE